MYVSKDALNYVLVHLNAKTESQNRSDKNEVFSLSCMLVDMPMGGYSPLTTLLSLNTLLKVRGRSNSKKHLLKKINK